MKKTLCILVVACLFAACKKSTSPSVIGTWSISNISGTSVSKTSPNAPTLTTTYFYANNVLSQNDTGIISTIAVYKELWQFNSDGTFSIYEDYQADTATLPTIHTVGGWWDYTSSTVANNCVVLRSTGTPTVLPMGGTFLISSVTATQLMITVNETNTLSTGSTLDKDFTLTFSRQ